MIAIIILKQFKIKVQGGKHSMVNKFKKVALLI